MRDRLLGALLILAAAGCGGSKDGGGAGQTINLQNDGFSSGGSAAFQGGFVAGEQASVTLGPVGRSFQVKKVHFLFGGAAGAQTVTLHITADSGTSAPGAEAHFADYLVTPSDTAIQEIDLSGAGVMLPAGSFRVAIEFQVAGLPSVARDGDGNITANRNWILASGLGWVGASSLGVTGDWIIRAEVLTL